MYHTHADIGLLLRMQQLDWYRWARRSLALPSGVLAYTATSCRASSACGRGTAAWIFDEIGYQGDVI